MMDAASPYSYAQRLASYISDASTVRARTRDEFGRAPPLDIIQGWIAERSRPVRPRSETRICVRGGNHLNDDGEHWRPRGLVKTEEPRRERAVRATLAAMKREPAPEPKPKPKPQGPREIITARDVIEACAAELGFTHADILGDSRKRPVIRARRLICFVLHKRGNSYPQAGRYLGTDHSTVIHSVRQFALHATDEEREIARKYYDGEALAA